MSPPMRENSMPPAARGPGKVVVRTRTRSFCFLERPEGRWTAFLITYRREAGQWCGYFSFRSASGDPEFEEVRTADLFVESTEEEVDQRARSLGRPLVLALLESALDTQERRRGFSPDLRRWFREVLARHARERGPNLIEFPVPGADSPPTLSELRSRYESYRLDQVSHLIALLGAEDFRELVELRLEGRRIDFRAGDRFQLAMTIVQDLERRLPLPPFEVWAEDYLAHTDEYRRYAQELHQGEDPP